MKLILSRNQFPSINSIVIKKLEMLNANNVKMDNANLE